MGAVVTPTLLSIGAGLTLTLLYTASPLTVWVMLAAAVMVVAAGRGLPLPDRRALTILLAAALTTRLLFVSVSFLAGLPHHNDLSIGALSGDDAYYLSRALRTRDLLLGFARTHYDFFVTNDEYGRTSYLALLTSFQVIFGPTPYSMKLFNGLLFTAGGALLFRPMRESFGLWPALAGLATLLFLPSLFVSSVSLLKESLYFLIASILLVASLNIAKAVSAGRWRMAPAWVAAAAASLWVLNDLRRGALILAVTGLALAIAIRAIAGDRRRVAAVAVVLLLGGTLALSMPAVQDRVLDGVVAAAKSHSGHVFTVGHAYKLMDEGFYTTPQMHAGWDLELSGPQAARFLIRAGLSFFLTPLPWELRSSSELAFLPEHVVWYVLLLLLPAGVVYGWRQDPMLTSLLLGFAIPTAVVVALTTGNVGTLLRLRGLVTPYLIWLSAVGLVALGERLARASLQQRGQLRQPAPEGAAS
jgi:hypothetical protein